MRRIEDGLAKSKDAVDHSPPHERSQDRIHRTAVLREPDFQNFSETGKDLAMARILSGALGSNSPGSFGRI